MVQFLVLHVRVAFVMRPQDHAVELTVMLDTNLQGLPVLFVLKTLTLWEVVALVWPVHPYVRLVTQRQDFVSAIQPQQILQIQHHCKLDQTYL